MSEGDNNDGLLSVFDDNEQDPPLPPVNAAVPSEVSNSAMLQIEEATNIAKIKATNCDSGTKKRKNLPRIENSDKKKQLVDQILKY